MEMHQVRYFLAVARTLNFTKAADECNVAQPSLSRAIKHLEAEFGGDLFRRERPAAQLTELGQRMLPLLKQSYDAAAGARQLASSLRKGEIGALRLALTHSVDLAIVMPHLRHLKALFSRLEIHVLRGSNEQVSTYLKNGEAELGISCEVGQSWDRFDVWPLFTEDFLLIVADTNKLAERGLISMNEFLSERVLLRTDCDYSEQISTLLLDRKTAAEVVHKVATESDMIEFLEVDFGMALAPRSARLPAATKRVPVDGIDVRRTVRLYGVAGRERSAAATAVMKMLRSAEWAGASS